MYVVAVDVYLLVFLVLSVCRRLGTADVRLICTLGQAVSTECPKSEDAACSGVPSEADSLQRCNDARYVSSIVDGDSTRSPSLSRCCYLYVCTCTCSCTAVTACRSFTRQSADTGLGGRLPRVVSTPDVSLTTSFCCSWTS